MSSQPLALRVDIIDDDDAVRDSLSALLESYGYVVRGFASALHYLKRDDRTPSDCLIVDHHMPGMTGLELLEALQAQGGRIPSLMVTGRNDPSLEPRLARVGVTKLLHKPIDDEQLVGWIEEACARSAPAHGQTPQA